MPEQPDRRAAILQAAADLFARQGVTATTVRQIAEHVGMLSGSLYHYFPSKDAIVEEIISGFLDDLRTRYREVMAADLGPRERIQGLVTASLQIADRQPSATLIYQNELPYLRELPRRDEFKAAAAEVQQAWLDAIEAGRASGIFRTDIDTGLFYRFIRDAVWLSVRWYRPEGDRPLEQLAHDCASIFLDGIAPK